MIRRGASLEWAETLPARAYQRTHNQEAARFDGCLCGAALRATKTGAPKRPESDRFTVWTAQVRRFLSMPRAIF